MASTSATVPIATTPTSRPPPDVLLPLLSRCSTVSHLKQLHARVLRAHSPHLFLYGRLVHLAASIPDLPYAVRLLHCHRSFLLSTPPNSFVWNTLLSAFSRHPHLKLHSLQLYLQMLHDGRTPPDKFTFPFLLKACAFLFLLKQGTQLQSHVVKLGLASDVYINNSFIHFYASCGQMGLARKVFDEMPVKTPVSWNVLIDGYARCGEWETALEMFREMQASFDPDGYALQSVTTACGGLGALSLGMWAHAYILKRWKNGDKNLKLLVNNSLLDMYCKFGYLRFARQLFDAMPQRDVASWNSMIFGYATNGQVHDAFLTFSAMLEMSNVKPNSITFVGVLSSCNHSGMVIDGLRYFELMPTQYNIEPQIEHYGCIVDLLARAGRIEEALSLVANMPCEPDEVIWRSLLDACTKRNIGVEMGHRLASRILDTEGHMSSGAYMLLSRMYAAAEQWDNVGEVRRVMEEEGVRKEPGCSAIEVGNAVHEFLAGDTSHPRSREVYEMLQVVEAGCLLPL